MRKPADTLHEQVEMEFGPRVMANALWRPLLDEFRAIVHRVTPKEAAHQLDTSGSNLGDALFERDRKALRFEAGLVLLLMIPVQERLAVLRPLMRGLGFDIEPTKKLTPEQENQRLRQALRSLGKVGETLITEALK